MELREKYFVGFLAFHLFFLYNIIGYRIDMIFTKRIFINLPIKDAYEILIIIGISMLTLFICLMFNRKGYSFKEDLTIFYAFLTPIPTCAYVNMWLTNNFWLSILLSLIGITGVVYLRGKV